MFYNYSIEKLVGLQDIEVKNIETSDSDIRLFCRMKRKPHKCPACGNLTNRIHDYRVQVIKDCPVLGKNFFICLEKRRYICSCSKRFYEKVSFIPRYHRMTHRLVCNIIDALKSTLSFTDVSKRFNVSVSTVIRIFDFVSFKKPELSNVVSIDEFKGNVWGENINVFSLTRLIIKCLTFCLIAFLTALLHILRRLTAEKMFIILFPICGERMKAPLKYSLKTPIRL